MISNELQALLQMAIAEETCGVKTATATTLEVAPSGLQTAPATNDVVNNNNNNTPNWWMWIAIAAAIYAISKK